MNEDEIKKIIEEMGKRDDMPQCIRINVRYDKTLQKITNTESEPILMSEWSTVTYLLQNIFMAYPEIEEKYPPGALSILINDVPPKVPTSPLFDGDTVDLSILKTMLK